MLLTEEQAKERLNSERNLLNRFERKNEREGNVVEIIPVGRSGGYVETPLTPEVKTEITARARLGETQHSLAEEFGIHQCTVSSLEHGARRFKIDEEAVSERMGMAQDKALCKLVAALGFLDDSKLSKLGAKELSAVAANMSKVVGSVRPSVGDGNSVHVHLYAPELRKESNYKTIEVHSV